MRTFTPQSPVELLPPVCVGGWLTARGAKLIIDHRLRFVHECTPEALAQLPGFGPLTIHQIQRWIATHQYTEGTSSDTDRPTDDETGTAHQPTGSLCVRDAATAGHHSWRTRRNLEQPASADDQPKAESAAATKAAPPDGHVSAGPTEVHTTQTAPEALTLPAV